MHCNQKIGARRIRALHCPKANSFALMASLMFALAAPAVAQTTRVVDADGHATAIDCASSAATAFTSIQAAVDAAQPGDTIRICPGVYNEQVVITKANLALVGAGAGVTAVRPTVLTPKTTSVVAPGQPAQSPILLVDGVSGVSVAGLSIDGALAVPARSSGNPNCGFQPHTIGIAFRNASGSVDSVHVTNVQPEVDCGFGVRVENGPQASSRLLLSRSRIERYADAGISCAGLQTECTITDNVVLGAGPVNFGQVGVIIRGGSFGSITNNLITDHVFIDANGTPNFSVGIFLAAADPNSNPHLLRDNTFANNQLDVQRQSTEAAIR